MVGGAFADRQKAMGSTDATDTISGDRGRKSLEQVHQG
jgi:hypothetical protein